MSDSNDHGSCAEAGLFYLVVGWLIWRCFRLKSDFSHRGGSNR